MLKNVTIKSLLITVMGVLCLLLLVTGGIGLTSLNTTNKVLESVYEDSVIPMGQLDTVQTLLAMNELDLATSTAGEPAQINAKMDAIEKRWPINSPPPLPNSIPRFRPRPLLLRAATTCPVSPPSSMAPCKHWMMRSA